MLSLTSFFKRDIGFAKEISIRLGMFRLIHIGTYGSTRTEDLLGNDVLLVLSIFSQVLEQTRNTTLPKQPHPDTMNRRL